MQAACLATLVGVQLQSRQAAPKLAGSPEAARRPCIWQAAPKLAGSTETRQAALDPAAPNPAGGPEAGRHEARSQSTLAGARWGTQPATGSCRC